MQPKSRLRAKSLRKNLTPAERKLWSILRSRQLAGYKFRRQEPVGNYIADFVCYERRLIVEVDGGQHMERRAVDEVRTEWLESQGFRVVRFWNDKIFNETESVVEVILDALNKE